MPSNQPLEAPTYMKQIYFHHNHKKSERIGFSIKNPIRSDLPSIKLLLYKLLFLRKVLNNCAFIFLYVNTRIRAVNKRELRREVSAVDVIDNWNM